MIEVWLQALCPAVDQPRGLGFSSLSRERSPDIVITQTRQQQPTRFIVLDAKYRTSRSNVPDAMGSAHLYHDSLRWNGCKPDIALLLIPRADQVRGRIDPVLFTDLPYSEAHGKASSSTLPGIVAHLEQPHQFLQLVGVEPYRFRTGLQHDHSLAHLC